MRSAIGVLLGLFVRAYLRTLRVTIDVDASLDPDDPRPWVLCFWHGEQLPLFAWKRRRKTVALVSHSPDGQMQTRALRLQGLTVERGSSSRGGARGLVAIIRRLQSGHDAAFALDGPRGPRCAPSPGARLAAAASFGRLVPMGSAAPVGWTLARAWDRFRIPMPFSRVSVCLGPPLEPSAELEELGLAVTRASERAHAVLASPEHAVLHHVRRA